MVALYTKGCLRLNGDPIVTLNLSQGQFHLSALRFCDKC